MSASASASMSLRAKLPPAPGQPRQFRRHLPRVPPFITTWCGPASPFTAGARTRASRTRCRRWSASPPKSCRSASWTPGATIGYGAIYRVQRPSRIATIGCGYADGFLRALSVKTGEAGPVGFIGDYPVPIVGRVSMDFITVDVTDVPPSWPAAAPGWR